MFKLIPIFKIRILYKSGYTHDFEVYDFKYVHGSKASWSSVSDENKPLEIGLDDIAAVYQIGLRKVLWK
jgi:hypothetical protein